MKHGLVPLVVTSIAYTYEATKTQYGLDTNAAIEWNRRGLEDRVSHEHALTFYYFVLATLPIEPQTVSLPTLDSSVPCFFLRVHVALEQALVEIGLKKSR